MPHDESRSVATPSPLLPRHARHATLCTLSSVGRSLVRSVAPARFEISPWRGSNRATDKQHPNTPRGGGHGRTFQKGCARGKSVGHHIFPDTRQPGLHIGWGGGRPGSRGEGGVFTVSTNQNGLCARILRCEHPCLAGLSITADTELPAQILGRERIQTSDIRHACPGAWQRLREGLLAAGRTLQANHEPPTRRDLRLILNAPGGGGLHTEHEEGRDAI